MKTALIITTINIPRVLELYRKLGPNVRFFVAGDKKTPREAYEFVLSLGKNSTVCLPESGHKWKCSELLGWNNDSRRNIALLEAVKWGADIIVSCDDDMIPLSPDLFSTFEDQLTEPFSGLQFGRPGWWCDAGQFTTPRFPQRGLPIGHETFNDMSFATDAQVGAVQGIILGTPDTDAITMASKPHVTDAVRVLQGGMVAHPEALGVFNSQFTAFRRELAPAFAQFYKWQGRNTDIFASLIMRRVMREKNLHTYYGPPVGYHARTERPPLKDLASEMYGLEHVQALATVLEHMDRFAVDKPIVRQIYEKLVGLEWWPADCATAMFAWLDDMEGVL